MPQETQTRRILIKIDAGASGSSLKQLAGQFGQLNQSMKGTKDILTSFRNLGGGLLGASIFGFGVRELTGIADSMQLTKDRIAALLGPTVNATEVIQKLGSVAEFTKGRIGDIGETFSRVAVATKDLGLSTNGLLGLTTALQQSYRISGATAAEASASTIQFAQALSFGQLRGQELRSVLSQNATLAGIFREAIAGTGKDIFKFAEAGGFTSKFVLEALAKNFDKLNKDASKLGQTFEQTLILASNKFQLAIGRLNEEFDLNGKFARGVDYLINNLPKLAGIMSALAITTVPALVASMGRLGAIFLTNPITAGIAAIVAGLAIFTDVFEDLPLKAELAFNRIGLGLEKLKEKIFGTLAFGLQDSVLISSNFKDRMLENYANAKTGAESAVQDIAKTLKKLEDAQKQRTQQKQDPLGLKELEKALQKDAVGIKGRILSVQEQIGFLNAAFNKGSVGVQRYNQELLRLNSIDLNEKLNKGTISLDKYNKELRELRLQNVEREFKAGTISAQQFDQALKQFKLEELNQKLADGKLKLIEYNREVARLGESFGEKLYVELSDYVERTGDLFTNLSRGVVATFGHLEDALVDFTKRGRFEFAKFTQAVLEDLNRIIIRSLIIRPLAEGVLSAILPSGGDGGGGGAGSSSGGNINSPNSTLTSAHGNAFLNGRVQAFASGGIVNRPTYFKYGGKLGLMGEAGSEAILPLKRGPGGDLGVQATGSVNINVINNSGGQVDTRETVNESGDRTVDIIITAAVKDALSSGALDKSMSQLYGLKRRGT